MRLLTYACVTDTVILLLRSKRGFAVTEIMSKRITLREACSELGVQEDDLNIDNDDNLEGSFSRVARMMKKMRSVLPLLMMKRH